MTLTMKQTERKLAFCTWAHLPVFVKGNILTLMFLRYILSCVGWMCISKGLQGKVACRDCHFSYCHR